ncbi:MAG: hypothetical protein ACUZ9M_07070 [Candidatus Scalindua sp.]
MQINLFGWYRLASPTRLSGGKPESERSGSINMIEPARGFFGVHRPCRC